MPETEEHFAETEPDRPRRYRRRVWLIAVAALMFAFGLAWVQSVVLPKRFAVVVDDRLYRSGTVTAAHLERLSNDYGVRTVLSLLNAEAPETIVERAAAETLGLRWINVPLPGNGASTPEQRQRIKQVLFDDSLGGLLVHCAAGTNRTGLAVGMYRLHRQGWTVNQVLSEMRRFDFEDEPHHENLRQALVAEAALANE